MRFFCDFPKRAPKVILSKMILGGTWCSFGPCGTDVCNEAQALETIAAMETNGMKTAGYSYVTLDDW